MLGQNFPIMSFSTVYAPIISVLVLTLILVGREGRHTIRYSSDDTSSNHVDKTGGETVFCISINLVLLEKGQIDRVIQRQSLKWEIQKSVDQLGDRISLLTQGLAI